MTKSPDNGNILSCLLQWITNVKKELLPHAIHHSSHTFFSSNAPLVQHLK